MQVPVEEPNVVIEEIVRRHMDKPGAAIPILQEIQNTFGYVEPAFLQRVSELTKIPASDLYSIVTFYAQFRLEQLGENHIQVCSGTACHLAGAEEIINTLQRETHTKCGCTSEDKKFTLETVACLGCCSLAPVANINGKTHGRLTPEQIKEKIKALQNKAHEEGDDE